MAKGKGGKRSVSSGPHKKHGPKKKMFNEYKPMVVKFAQAGLLNKYSCLESFILACQSRGLRHGTQEDWKFRFQTFRSLDDRKKQLEWLRDCKNLKEDKKKKV